jgi:biotin operon repressor
MTVRAEVLTTLSSRKWISGAALEEISPDALRRVRELRAQGYEIKNRAMPGARIHEYRLVRLTPSA